MPARKVGSKGAKVRVRAPAKRAMPLPCPEIPIDFFKEVAKWSKLMKTWAMEVDSCYEDICGTTKRKKKLLALCAEFSTWSNGVKRWADDVEDCFQEECHGGGGPPSHTKPPPPPF